LASCHQRKTALQHREYLDEIFAVILVEPFNGEMGTLAAEIDSSAKNAGRVISLADLLIG
jgi:predicted nucleic acid-binding protein